MPQTLRRPFDPQPLIDISDTLSRSQIGWWLANEQYGTRLVNIANSALFNGTLQAGATRGLGDVGPCINLSGAAASYVDLGTTALLAGTDPFTFQWLEYLSPTPPAFTAVATFMPSGNTQRFIILHEDSDIRYAQVSVGLGTTSQAAQWGGATPTMASGVGIWRQWILTGTAGMSGSFGTMRLYADGMSLGLGSPGSAFGALTANLNYLGWDGADSQMKGALSNCRLWNRVLTNPELDRLIANPYAGIKYRRNLIDTFIPASAPLWRMFNAM